MENSANNKRSDIVSLRELYDFVRKRRNGGDEVLRVDRGDPGKEYCARSSKITQAISESQGFYLWGKYDKRGCWHNIYLGMAGYSEGKKNLKKRIHEERKDERACVWRHVYSGKQLHEIRDRIHDRRYEKPWSRAMRKEGATHIVWVATPEIDAGHVGKVEADLIEVLNPVANRTRPRPQTELQDKTIEILKVFRAKIHVERQNGYVINVVSGA